jgi:hypothetical protein
MDGGYDTAPEKEILHPKSQFGRQILTRVRGRRRSTLANHSGQRRFCPARNEFGQFGATGDGPANSEVKCRNFQLPPALPRQPRRAGLLPRVVTGPFFRNQPRPKARTARSNRMNGILPEPSAQFSWSLGPEVDGPTDGSQPHEGWKRGRSPN